MSIILTDGELGALELRSKPFVVASFQVGSRAPRRNVTPRALADGEVDSTRYGGGRVVTVSLVLNEDACADVPTTMQDLYDRILPYMAQYRRPTLRWTVPGSPDKPRELTVRGEDAPVIIAQPKHAALTCQFYAADGTITSPGRHSIQLFPTSDDPIGGRAYNLAFDRTYPAATPVGAQTVEVEGNERADWTLVIHGPVTNPFFQVNETTIRWDQNGGLTMPAGTSLVVSSKDKTMYLNGNPVDPRYDRANFYAWSWHNVLLRKGVNTVRYGAETSEAGSTAYLTWLTTWAG